jgi:putative transposase
VPYKGFRFRAAVISCAVRWYHRFNLSLRDVEELLLERGVTVTYESVRNWCDGSVRSLRVARKRRAPAGFDVVKRSKVGTNSLLKLRLF